MPHLRIEVMEKLLYEEVLKEDLSDDSIYFRLYNKDDVMVAGFSLSNENYKGKL